MRSLIGLFLLASALLGNSAADAPIWMPPTNDASPYFRIVVDGRAGYIDQAGRVIIPPSLPALSNRSQAFYDGLLSLSVVGAPFLNIRGEKILDRGFNRISNFSEGLAIARRAPKSLSGYINYSGEFVIPPQFPNYPEGLLGYFSEGFAQVEIGGKAGYIDRKGKFVIPLQFATGTAFENGYARVVVQGDCGYFDHEHNDPFMASHTVPKTGKNRPRDSGGTFCKWRFIDKGGRLLFDREFDEAFGFHEGLAAVRVGNLWGFIDQSGRFAIPRRFRLAKSFSDGRAYVEGDGLTGFIDIHGNMRIRMKSDHSFSEGLAVRPVQGGYSYMDIDGRRVISETFEVASRYFYGLAHVRLRSGRFAYIDKRGKHVFEY